MSTIENQIPPVTKPMRKSELVVRYGLRIGKLRPYLWEVMMKHRGCSLKSVKDEKELLVIEVKALDKIFFGEKEEELIY